ncbi:quinone oxidoreductase family protein [Kitasatospora viridis]|uniref:NADPH2:quinone reductase n=1 Tax=Kitasatospora viridis TaxID=281105 RepID=A0A561T6S9_9ACTN|nr:zinc-binding dehydrogenase [Kitasatospora viridis]TWF82808.1 NADPH2:quinone reductase [Kitasatospora viridis]
MRAIVLDHDSELRLTGLDRPEPGPGEVAVQVTHAGLQWGDVLLKDGFFPVPRPFVPGFEAAGRIGAVGAGVPAERIGEAVTVLATGGAFAQTLVVPAEFALPVGELPLATAAGFGWSTPTAYDLVHHVARVQPGDTVLVHAAAGGVGTMAAQFARRAGAGRLVGVVGSPERAAYAAEFGYDQVVLRADFPAALGEQRFDVVLDPVGGRTRSRSLELLAPHGRLALYGVLDAAEPVAADTTALLMAGQSVLGYSSDLLYRTRPDRFAASARAALAEVTAGHVRIDVTAEYPVEDLARAVEQLRAGAVLGKAVLRLG